MDTIIDARISHLPLNDIRGDGFFVDLTELFQQQYVVPDLHSYSIDEHARQSPTANSIASSPSELLSSPSILSMSHASSNDAIDVCTPSTFVSSGVNTPWSPFQESIEELSITFDAITMYASSLVEQSHAQTNTGSSEIGPATPSTVSKHPNDTISGLTQFPKASNRSTESGDEQFDARAETTFIGLRNACDDNYRPIPRRKGFKPLHIDTSVTERTRRSGGEFRKIFKTVKDMLQSTWSKDDGDDDDEENLRWIYRPEIDTSIESPFYEVQPGVPFREIVPEQPSLFPYPSQIEYSSRYGFSVLPSALKSTENAAASMDEARLRERMARMSLRRLKTIGRFRRRPNITLPWVEGRINEPIEVARIRRAYSCTSLKPRRTEREEMLLEKINRQSRSGIVEWTVHDIRASNDNACISDEWATTVNEPVIVKTPSEEVHVSRRSLRRSVSTQDSGRRQQKKDMPYGPRSVFDIQWERNESRRHATGQYAGLKSGFPIQDDVAPTSLAIVPHSEKNERLIPQVTLTSCPTDDIASHYSAMPPLFDEGHREYLVPPVPHVLFEETICNELAMLPTQSNRLGLQPTHSQATVMSTVSSLANSIYSTLSEDWNRPIYFAKSKSPRYPVSLQTKIREPPPQVNVKVSIQSQVTAAADSETQMAYLADRIAQRELQHRDGSIIRPSGGDRLYEVGYRIALQPILEESAVPIARPHKTARPCRRDSFGFLKYDSDGGDDEGHDMGDELCTERVDTEGISTALEMDERIDPGMSESRPTLDVNDIRALVASGIDPTAPHPAPEAFYNAHYVYFQKHGCFREDMTQEDEEERDKECSVTSSLRSSDADGPDQQIFERAYRHQGAHQVRRPIRRAGTTGRAGLKQAYKSLQTFIAQPFMNPFSATLQMAVHEDEGFLEARRQGVAVLIKELDEEGEEMEEEDGNRWTTRAANGMQRGMLPPILPIPFFRLD
ncbi:hypothetical protein BGZ54_007905 [Gamsiella multidivaricata]|nr:hypothetical protein BGZ54_007905 [Gamsiella multidivaricata]